MKVKLNVKLKDAMGQDTENIVSENVAMALYVAGSDAPLGREEKYRAYRINKSIIDDPNNVELSSEDITLVKDICGKYFVAGTYGQLEDILENRQIN